MPSGAGRERGSTKGERHLRLDVCVPTPAAAINVAEQSEDAEEPPLSE